MAKTIDRPGDLDQTPEFEAQKNRWEKAWASRPARRTEPGSGATDRTISDLPLKPLYGPDDVAHLDLARDLAYPGEYPYTRGIHSGMYRDRLWTMRQFAGFGSAEDTNGRFKELLRAGGDGLSTAFDMPTLLGRDSDDPLAKGEVGRAGVAVDT
ncbi:MAG TPA: methylmalonyl-CoA mutase family protein, partial [Candidatus Baltobacteraceae bacterium]|nr:methylmalonyl-CoA mutase family protein [Candidatus Baltobacteraceae bacterium]